MSAIPSGSWLIFGMNVLLVIISAICFMIFLKKCRSDSKRYYSLLSYVFTMTLGIYMMVPLFRIMYGSVIFLGVLLIIVFMLLLPHIFREEIAYGVQKPGKSKLGKIYLIYTFLVLTIGGMLYKSNLVAQTVAALQISIILFFLAMLLLFLAPVFLIKPKDMEEIENRE